MKLSNFARLDPALRERDIKGLPKGAKGEAEVWKEFKARPEALVFESERLIAARLGQSVEDTANIDTRDLPPPGLEREALVRIRVNQAFFRRRIVSGYNNTCCVTGLTIPDLLVASRILPWSTHPEHRLNPRNGLCLNALHDRAFDRGLMWVEDDLTIRFSPRITVGRRGGAEIDAAKWMTQFEGARLRIASKLAPDVELLRRHRRALFHRVPTIPLHAP